MNKKNTVPSARRKQTLDDDLYLAVRRNSGQPSSLPELEEQQRAAHTLRFVAINSKESSGGAASTDVVLTRQLRAALIFDYDLVAACFERNIISSTLHTSLALAQFITLVLPWARTAQSITGVRASLLIAESFNICCLGSCLPVSNDFFATRKSFANGKDSFIYRGYAIQSDPKFRGVMLADDTDYVKELEKWSLGNADAKELVSVISNFGLESCDSITL